MCVQVRMWCSRAWGRVCWTTPSWATTPASLLMDRQVRVKNLGNIRSSSILLLAWVLKVKLSPKCNLGLLCECIWGQTDFQWECYGHFYNSIKICIFKTVRSLDTTWNSAGSITRVSTHQHQQFTKKKVFEQLMLAVACSARRRPASGEESMSEWDVTWRTVKVELLSSNNYPHQISRHFSGFWF